MYLSFILVHPVVPENVGFCARGLTTMGFADLRIVGEPIHREKGARNTAYGAHDLLNDMQVFGSLNEAIADCNLVVGTTAKQRIKRYDPLSPKALKKNLNAKPTDTRIALVFGSETNGLSNEDIALCDLVTTIPLATTYPSLNLAQAVMVYAYELSGLNNQRLETTSVSDGLMSSLKTEANTVLGQLDYDAQPIKKQRIMDRLVLLGKDDLELSLGVLKRIAKRLGS